LLNKDLTGCFEVEALSGAMVETMHGESDVLFDTHPTGLLYADSDLEARALNGIPTTYL